MFWQEKIDILKKRFSPDDFRDPFIDASEILKKIETKFIKKKNHDYPLTDWPDHIIDKVLIRSVSSKLLQKEIEKLDNTTNYWIVVTMGISSVYTNYIYDCKRNSLESLLSFTPTDFYIVDKKYQWFTYFERGKENLMIYKSTCGSTPFDIE